MKNIIKCISVALVLLSLASCEPYETYPEGDPALEHVYYVSNVKTGVGTNFYNIHEIAADGIARMENRLHFNPIPAGVFLWELVTSQEQSVTCPVRLRFISERVRSYDAVTYFWIESGDCFSGAVRATLGIPTAVDRGAGNPNPLYTWTAVPNRLQDGRDFEVLTESGTKITPNANGAYTLTWPQAKKQEQSIKIRRISDTPGEIRVQMLERSKLTFPNASLPDDFDRNALDEHINNQTSEYTVRGLWHDYKYPTIIQFRSAITATSTGLGSLRVGQAVSGANVVFTLYGNYTYATSIIEADFTISGLPEGLTAGTATRTSATVVTVPITGTPTVATTVATPITIPSTVTQANVPNFSKTVTVLGPVSASIVAN